MATVCLVTTGHPSTNPRLVKEADALAEAGYDVRVVATKFWQWASEADAAFDNRLWPISYVRFGEMATGVGETWVRARQRAAREVAARVGPRELPKALLERAVHYVTVDLRRLAEATTADLYIAHNLGALPAAAAAARRHGARLGFDAEDFHRGELSDSPENEARRALIAAVEDRYLPQCDYVTAASDGISEAYAAAVGIECPVTVLNVFPLSERDVEVSADELAAEVPEGTRSLYWFSQTIGPGRGLEDAVHALPLLPDDVGLSLRGGWAAGYERDLRGLADRLGVGHRLWWLAHCRPDEVVRRAAEHNVGLALEEGATLNRDLCVTNKLFTYFLAGLPAAATATTGQRGVCVGLDRAAELYEPGDATGLANAICQLLEHPAAAAAAYRVGTERFNWDVERVVFLDIVAETMGGRRKAER